MKYSEKYEEISRITDYFLEIWELYYELTLMAFK